MFWLSCSVWIILIDEASSHFSQYKVNNKYKFHPDIVSDKYDHSYIGIDLEMKVLLKHFFIISCLNPMSVTMESI